jgi:hypothetical protein
MAFGIISPQPIRELIEVRLFTLEDTAAEVGADFEVSWCERSA